MPSKAVVEDLDQFYVYLSNQPLCKWAAQKQRELLANESGARSAGSSAAKNNDNADLMAALSSMA